MSVATPNGSQTEPTFSVFPYAESSSLQHPCKRLSLSRSMSLCDFFFHPRSHSISLPHRISSPTITTTPCYFHSCFNQDTPLSLPTRSDTPDCCCISKFNHPFIVMRTKLKNVSPSSIQLYAPPVSTCAPLDTIEAEWPWLRNSAFSGTPSPILICSFFSHCKVLIPPPPPFLLRPQKRRQAQPHIDFSDSSRHKITHTHTCVLRRPHFSIRLFPLSYCYCFFPSWFTPKLRPTIPIIWSLR